MHSAASGIFEKFAGVTRHSRAPKPTGTEAPKPEICWNRTPLRGTEAARHRSTLLPTNAQTWGLRVAGVRLYCIRYNKLVSDLER